MIRSLFFAFSFLYIISAYGQSIKGRIVDSKSQPIPLGNVIVLRANDSVLVKGDAFMDGIFKIEEIPTGSFLLKVTSVGYQDHFQSLSIPDSSVSMDLGEIQLLNAGNLKEVEVVGTKPMFERDAEKVKVNVESSALSSVGTVLDVLKRSPTVRVDASDNVSVFGKGAAVVYVDGQLIASNDVLKTISSNDIKEIEIISNPSAKYDAAGKAVINIITKKNNLEGYNGNLIQNVLYDEKHAFTYSGIRFNYKKKKWSTFLGYGFPHGKGWSSDKYYRQLQSNGSTQTEMSNAIYHDNFIMNTHNYKAGITYSMDSVTNIGFQYSGYYSQTRDQIDNVNEVSKNHVPDAVIKTYTVSQPVLTNNTATLNFSRTLDTLKSDLSITAQYGDFLSNNRDDINQSILVGGLTNSQLKRSTGNNHIQIATGQADLSKLFNKKWKLETGIKESYVDNKSAINFANFSSAGSWVDDPSYVNGYSYSENVGALYAQTIYTKNKFTARAGLRTELTNSTGFSKATATRVIDRHYAHLFPSAYAGYDFNKDLNAGITYSTRIARPSFQDMDPFIQYIDSLSSFRGNPYLLTAYTHSLEASLIYMKEASFTLSYSRTNGAMNLVVDKLNDGSDAFVATTKNLDYSETYSVGITIPYELSWWTTYNYFGYMQNNFRYTSAGSVVNNSKPMFYMYLYDEFRFKKLFSMEVTFEYTGSGVDGMFNFDPFYDLSANLKKTFFKDKLTVRLVANDILKTNFTTGNSNVPGYNVRYESKSRTHFYQITLNYRFGKLKANDYRDKSVSNEEFQRIKTK